MLERLPVIEKTELVHAKRQDSDLRNAAVNICADVLQFCIEASDLFVDKHGSLRGSARLLLASVWSSFEAKFGKLKSDFDRHVRLFDTYAQLALTERQEDFMRERERRDVMEDEAALRRAAREKQLELAEQARAQGMPLYFISFTLFRPYRYSSTSPRAVAMTSLPTRPKTWSSS
jgi:hypothetical protein